MADFLSTPAAVTCAAVWGAVWGSFLNVVIGRLPRGESIVHPPSRCPSCGNPIRPWDNIPVLSYLLLRGRCRGCAARISPRYPLIEALMALLAAAIFWVFAGSDAGEVVAVRLGRFCVYFVFAGTLLVLSFIDLDTQRLPDVITIPGIFILYAAAFAAHDISWKERAIGAAAGYLFVRLVADFYFHVLKREGLGLGDGKLLAMIGAVLGWKALPVVLFTASVVGTCVSIPILILTRKRRNGELSLRQAQVPFGPFLAVGALVYLFAGRQILDLVVPPG